MADNIRVIPFDDLEVRKYYHILKKAGYDPERLARTRPAQIIYSFGWQLPQLNNPAPPTPSVPNPASNEDLFHSIRISNNDASMVTGMCFSVVEPAFAVNRNDDPNNAVDYDPSTPASRRWARADDPAYFSHPRNPLDYISMHVQQNANEQLSTDYVPLSHWMQNRSGWMPSQLDFLPGGNYSAYEMLFRADRHLYFKRLDISITAIQLIGL